MSDFQRRVDTAIAAGDAAALVALSGEADNKKARKAVKRGLYLLEQRGVAIPELPKTSTAPGQTLGPATLPVLMGSPERDAGRLFTLAVPDGASVTVLEAFFRMPEGLDRLQGSSSSRASYVPWSQRMCTKTPGSPPQRVRVDGGMLRRKLWEIRECVREQRLGPDVDLDLARRVVSGVEEVPHPGRTQAASGGRILSMSALADRRWALAPFYQEAPQAELRRKANEAGAHTIRAVDSPMGRAAADWADQWGHDRIRELLFDCACFASGMSDADAAHTLREAAADPERFIVDYVQHQFG